MPPTPKPSPQNDPQVFVIDDDDGVRSALQTLLRSVGLRVSTFGSPAEFLASQMPDARGNTVSVRIAATTTADVATEWSASGRTITFPGWQAVYGFSGDDDAVEAGDDTAKLPAVEAGQALPAPLIDADGHSTVDRILDLLAWTELNEFKATSIPR